MEEKLKCSVLNVLPPKLIVSLPKKVTFCLIILPETALICAAAFTMLWFHQVPSKYYLGALPL